MMICGGPVKYKAKTRYAFPVASQVVDFCEEVDAEPLEEVRVPYGELQDLLAHYESLTQDNTDLEAMLDEALEENRKTESFIRSHLYDRHKETDQYVQ